MRGDEKPGEEVGDGPDEQHGLDRNRVEWRLKSVTEGGEPQADDEGGGEGGQEFWSNRLPHDETGMAQRDPSLRSG